MAKKRQYKRKRKIDYKRVLILLGIAFLILILLIFIINKFKNTGYEEVVSTSGLDADKFVLEDGLMVYNDSDYESYTGIDVSSFQKDIDWQQVKDDGIQFVMIRCGFRGMTDGELYLDPYYQANIEGASAAGLDVGIYFYSSAITEEELQEEITFVSDLISGYNLTYPIGYDMEDGDNARISALSTEQKTQFTDEFCSAFQEMGYDTLIYGNKNWLYYNINLSELQDYGIWYAAYQSKPALEEPFEMWQYSNSGDVAGIDNRVDVNLCIKKK